MEGLFSIFLVLDSTVVKGKGNKTPAYLDI